MKISNVSSKIGQKCLKSIKIAQNLGHNFDQRLNFFQDETVSADWCDASARNETPMVLEFVEQSDWAVYVTAKDKEMMQLHLLV
jgi:hypothetical protein